MKKNTKENFNGISICDSIVMSVKEKRPNTRTLEAIIISVIGFVSVIMAFFGMFEFKYNAAAVAAASVIVSLFYIPLISMKKGGLWISASSLVLFAIAAFKMRRTIADGFKFVYNIIYKDSFHSEINYYKYLDAADEHTATTTLFIFAIWLIAFVIYFFTIHRPNMIMTLLVTFPIIEIGLYNGIEIPVFWGMLTVAYWLAMFCMTITDFGEYSGGTGGFIRKENVFSPKRHMKLKVTEKGGILVIATVTAISLAASVTIKLTDYTRSEKLNAKRKELSQAFTDFSVNNLTDSLSKITNVFGIDLTKSSKKLGSKDKITFQNKTDIIVDAAVSCDVPIYLKDSTGMIYGNNEWKKLNDDDYNDSVFNDFSKYKIFPQDFPATISNSNFLNNITITSKLDKDIYIAPYAVNNNNGLSYNRDFSVLPKDSDGKVLQYSFVPMDTESAIEIYVRENTKYPIPLSIPFGNRESFLYYGTPISLFDQEWKDKILGYVKDNDMITKIKYYDYGAFTQIVEDEDNDQYFDDEPPITLYMDGITLQVTCGMEYQASDYFPLNDPRIVMTYLLENNYRDYVYDTYLQLPDNSAMSEVREKYIDDIAMISSSKSIPEKINALTKLRDKIGSQTEYTLSPGKTPSNRDFVNYFLLENKKGYCVHYATAGVILARMAGIPARYSTGYLVVPDDFNDENRNADGSYTIEVQDNRSHAWVELYIDGLGWLPYEFTAGYTRTSNLIDDNDNNENTTTDPTATSAQQQSTSNRTEDSSQRTTMTTSKSATSASETDNVTVTDSNYGVGFGSGGGKKFPPLYIISAIAIPLLIAFAIYLRRAVILKIRTMRFKNGRSADRISHIFRYSNKLLLLSGISNTNDGYKGLSKAVEQQIGGIYFPAGDYDKFIDIALRNTFSEKSADREELKFCEGFVNSFASEIYKKSGFFHKIWMKLGSVIV